MTCILRLCLSALLSLALTGAGMTAGAEHGGPMPGQTEMVICSGDGAKTVTLDAEGNVVDPADCAGHGCPDCLQPGPALAPQALARPLPPVTRCETCLPRPERPLDRSAVTGTARGPPSEV